MISNISSLLPSGGAREVNDLISNMVRRQDNAEVKVTYSQTSVALSMADDLSALLSSMLQHRSADKYSMKASSKAINYAQILETKKPESIAKIISYAKDAGMAAKQFLFILTQIQNDPSDIALLLQAFIQKKKRASVDDNSSDELEDVPLALLEETYSLLLSGPNKKSIKTSVNIQEQVDKYSGLLAVTPLAMRDMYREFISEKKKPIDIYMRIVKTAGLEKRHLALDYLSKALHSDINSHDPSCSFEEFGSLLDTSFILNVIKSADILFMQGMKGISVLNASWQKSNILIFDYFYALIENIEDIGTLTANFIDRILKYHTKEDKINFLHVVQRLTRELPFFIFSDDVHEIGAIKHIMDHELSIIMSAFTETSRVGIRYE